MLPNSFHNRCRRPPGQAWGLHKSSGDTKSEPRRAKRRPTAKKQPLPYEKAPNFINPSRRWNGKRVRVKSSVLCCAVLRGSLLSFCVALCCAVLRCLSSVLCFPVVFCAVLSVVSPCAVSSGSCVLKIIRKSGSKSRRNPTKFAPEQTQGNPRKPEKTKGNPRESEETREKMRKPEETLGNPEEILRKSIGNP